MKKDTKKLGITASAVLVALSAPAYADTGGGKAMQAHVGDSEARATASGAAASSASKMASAFKADMARLESELNTANAAASATTESGVTRHVLGLAGMKTLMVKKNPDGTHTIGHVSNNEKSVDAFLEADDSESEEE